MILLIDNYDSFVHNLARYFEQLGRSTVVVRNDDDAAIDAALAEAAAVIVSPGPCTPAEAGRSVEIVQTHGERVPILGVCLGHQAIAAAYDGRIIRAAEPMHGRSSKIHHDGRGLFARLPNPLTGCRYHSLIVEEATLPDCLEVTARSDHGQIMALAHREHPVFGVQFHPESVLTSQGYELLSAFLRSTIDRPVAT